MINLSPKLYLLAVLSTLLTWGHSPGVLAQQQKVTLQQLEFFESRIRPILVTHCYECHSSKSKVVKSNLLLDTRTGIRKGGDSGPAVTPGKPAKSLLLDAVRYGDLQMPPKGQLSKQVIADFEKWIALGAADPRDGQASVAHNAIDFEKAGSFWAFQPPTVPSIPNLQSTWIKNDIDRFVLARLAKENLTPNPIANRSVLIRRAYLDLAGLPPTLKQVTSFLSDTDPRAYEKVVDQLLQSPAYGERWGRHWLDVARYGEDQAHTFKARKYPRGYIYRDWVIRSLNEDLPYDQFLFQQLAADLGPAANRHEDLPALGFFALGPVYYAENVEKAKAIADEWDDRIDTLTRGVLGLTVSCARCHDHKYDPITMEDYYGLAGIFASTQYQERPIVSPAVVAQKKAADQAVKDQQLSIDRFVLQASRDLRPSLVDQVPRYFLSSWRFINQRKQQKDEKKLYATISKEAKISPTLLRRWVSFLAPADSQRQGYHPSLESWLQWSRSQDAKVDLTADKKSLETVTGLANRFQAEIEQLLPRRIELLSRYGENIDFTSAADRATIKPGQVPLGNLFDDSKVVTLSAALSTDKYMAPASSSSRGVLRVVQGWGSETSLAPDITFRFTHLGSDTRQHGAIVNDSWSTGGLRTRGKKISPGVKRQEQGIGMHANALITFDLDEIRQAGLMPQDQPFRFKVDRAGMNDDVAGSKDSSAHLAVIVSRPHKKKEVLDAIISIHVNGEPVQTEADDFTYYISSPVPPPVTANGKFHSYDLAVPADARYLTLVTTGASHPNDNPISSDHTVFSGARLEFEPLPTSPSSVAVSSENDGSNMADETAARLLSRLFYDEGLLALPAAEAKSQLLAPAAADLKALQAKQQELKNASDNISIPLAHALRDAKSQDIKIYLQGDPAKQAAVAPRAMPAIFTAGRKTPFNPSGSGRLELAQALISPRNPLTARVMVNRVWAAHFGRGLVDTTSNFGQLGSRPTHPALLDYLTTRFTANGWSLKKLHRHIMLSATYCQSSHFRPDQAKKDGDNRWLWRMNRRRLEIESWRDSMLFVSGELDQAIGGPSLQLSDKKNRRRTVYGFVSRHRLDELLRLFDFPDPNITSASRTVTTVPLQQLFVLNSEFMMQRSRALSSRIAAEGGEGVDSRIQYAFQLLYQRQPDAEEVKLARDFLADVKTDKSQLTPWEQYALVLLAANEFMYID